MRQTLPRQRKLPRFLFSGRPCLTLRPGRVYDGTIPFSSPAIVSVSSTPSFPPAFDPTQLLMLMQDGEEHRHFVFELLESILRNGTTSLDAARQSWRHGKADHAMRQLHTVRGSLGSFGLRRFAATSLETEQALRSRQEAAPDAVADDGIDTLFDTTERALADGLADMRTWLNAQRLSMP
jgi:HPt (histidine-containing phosphotransfer) domain-containing protein